MWYIVKLIEMSEIESNLNEIWDNYNDILRKL